MQYIGIDLAWNPQNNSGIALLEDDKVLYNDTIQGLENIIQFINQYPQALVGIDAPLQVNNMEGNREIEKEFLQNYSSKKLGVYPVNRKLLLKYSSVIPGEVIVKQITQELGKTLFEIYPHVTIMNCFHNKVLPYKRKKGRNTAFIKEQLNILQNYLSQCLDGDFIETIELLKGKELKKHEDRLDALVAAYTLYISRINPYELYGGIFMVPRSKF